MTRPTSPALTLARPAITFLMVLNAIGIVGIAILVVPSPFVTDWPFRQLGFDVAAGHPALAAGLRTIAFLGLIGAGLVHFVLRWLRAIVDTVRVGDPFIAENARRLQAIAWCVLAGEGLRLAIGAIARLVDTVGQPVDMGEAFSFAPWLAVLLLFVLSGVFAQGARMRADLEGTV